jgi:hypothetical protein
MAVIGSDVTTTEAFRRNRQHTTSLLDAMRSREALVLPGGGAEAAARPTFGTSGRDVLRRW